MSEDDLKDYAFLYIPQFLPLDFNSILFTELTIEQPGNLTKWIFSAKYLGDEEKRTKYPTLRLYRGIKGNSQQLFGFMNSQPVPTNHTNIYECYIKPPFPVQAGDYIGFTLPKNAKLLLSIILNYGSAGGDTLGGAGVIDGIPLVTLEIGNLFITHLHYDVIICFSCFTSEPLPVTTVTSTPSISISMSASTYTTNSIAQSPSSDNNRPKNTGDPASSSDNTGAIVGAIVGLILAVILVLVVALLLVIVLRKKKHNVKVKGPIVTVSDANSHVPMDNPVYSGIAMPVVYCGMSITLSNLGTFPNFLSQGVPQSLAGKLQWNQNIKHLHYQPLLLQLLLLCMKFWIMYMVVLLGNQNMSNRLIIHPITLHYKMFTVQLTNTAEVTL